MRKCRSALQKHPCIVETNAIILGRHERQAPAEIRRPGHVALRRS